MPFAGFTPETSEFLWELAFHNERPWFQAHREQYLRVLKVPFDALARDTLALLQERYPQLPLQVHVSRIYRDARRLFGRGPYKDHLWFTIWSGADKHDNPAFWFELSAASYEFGVGFFEARPQEMEAYRRSIRENPAEAEKLARRLASRKEYQLIGPEYKRPKGDVGELLNPWYNRRWIGIDASFDFGGYALSEALPAILAEQYAFLMPYYTFLRRFADQGGENFADAGRS